MKLSFALLVAAASLASLPAASQSCPEQATKYSIGMISPEKAHVEITTTLASDYLVMAGFVSKSGTAVTDFVENVRIETTHAAADIYHTGNGAFPVAPFQPGDRVRVTYDLRLAHGDHIWDFGKEEVGVRLSDGAYLVSRVAMLADYGAPDCPIEIEFNTVDSAAPWLVTGDNTYRADSLDTFHNNAFAFGDRLDRLTATTRQGRVTFIHDEASTQLARQAAHDMARMTALLAKEFGGFPASNYHIFLLENDHVEGGAFNDSFAILHPAPAQKVDALVWRHGFIHEIIHLWLGRSIRPAQGADIEWFKEGFTDYLAIKTLWRLGYLNDQELTDKFENFIRRHTMGLFMSQGEVRLSEAGAQKSQNRMIIYGSGATLALMLDAYMSAEQHPGAFEAMLADLYTASQAPYTQERLLSSLNEATNGYAGAMLSQFDAGMSPMQIAAIIEPFGVEMAFQIPDTFELDLNPDGCKRMRCKPAFLRVKRQTR